MITGSDDEGGSNDYVENMNTYTDDFGYDDEESGDDYAEDEMGEVNYVVGMENFAVLSTEELEKQQNDDVYSISSVLSVSRVDAIMLLHHFNWGMNKAEEEWFRDGENIRKSIGLLTNPTKFFDFNDDDIVMCRICFEDFGVHQVTAASCGHLFCHACWVSYISFSINDGPGCLSLRCPDPKCSVTIGSEDMVKLISKEDENKYRKHMIRFYVENNKTLKWCPSPNCEYAIKYELGSESFDVKCFCSYRFCWNCLEEIHRPVDCKTVAIWNSKNKCEAENTTWILANSKPCPNCKKPIEKNLGCMHMTCNCKHQFCWLCLETWSNHIDHYRCNKYEKARKEGKFTQEERIRLGAKSSLDKYMHFYERWAVNEDSRKKSLVHLEELESEKLQKICDVQQVHNINDIDYITKAWEQIIECRRLLKWAYAYGYYIADEERLKREFFEFIQGEAEGALERLHECAENEVLQYADAKDPSPDFKNLKEKLCRLTRVTRDYFEHLVRALENDLVDVTSKDECKTGVADCSNELLAYQDWLCSRCTSYNSFDMQNCEACSHPRLDT